MIRVCFLTTSFPRFSGDFAGSFVFQTARGLVQQGIPVTIVAPASSHSATREVMDGIQVRRFRYWWPPSHQAIAYRNGIPTNLRRPAAWFQLPSFLLCFALKALQVGRHQDLVHVHWVPLVTVGGLLKKVLGVPIVVTTHGSDVRLVPQPITRRLLEMADAVLATSSELEARLIELGCPNIHRVPLPINSDEFHPDVESAKVRQELGVVTGQPVVTLVGRLVPFKDPLTLVDAIRPVLSRRKDVIFLIVGDGPLMPEIQRRIDRLGVGDHVRVTGARSDVAAILRLSSLFLALSPIENTWSTTIAEAMAVGVPCIITAAGQSPGFFGHQTNCFLVPPQNPGALADAILDLLSNPTLRHELTRGGWELLEANDRTLPRATARLLAVYQEVLGKVL
jgi:glycosyltransferase involved in cell wall biosynthesis